jgi:hypothetical protein
MIASIYPRSVRYGANTATPDSQSLRHRLIERRAYERWRAKGCPSDTALQDWLEAEAEVDKALELERFSYLCRTRIPTGGARTD